MTPQLQWAATTAATRQPTAPAARCITTTCLSKTEPAQSAGLDTSYLEEDATLATRTALPALPTRRCALLAQLGSWSDPATTPVVPVGQATTLLLPHHRVAFLAPRAARPVQGLHPLVSLAPLDTLSVGQPAQTPVRPALTKTQGPTCAPLVGRTVPVARRLQTRV